MLVAEAGDMANEDFAIRRDIADREILELPPGEHAVDGAIALLAPIDPGFLDLLVELRREFAVIVADLRLIADSLRSDDVPREQVEEVFRDRVIARELASARAEEPEITSELLI